MASPATAEARRAEALAARLPPLLVAAERVAATVAQGVHGRRRVGAGDSFWQFRPYAPGDPVARIDWRHAAKSGRPAPQGWFVRETEWEAAETVFLWCDRSPSMRWRSELAGSQKHARAQVLALALAALLLRGGELVALLAPDSRPVSGRAGLERLAADLLAPAPAGAPAGTPAGAPAGTGADAGLPPALPLPRHARAVLFGDFLAPLAEVRAAVARLAARQVSGFLMQVLDPAEVSLPYAGRVRFRGLEGEGEMLAGRAETLRAAYAARLAAQQDGLRALATAAGFGFAVHRTDHPPETALLGLYTALAGR